MWRVRNISKPTSFENAKDLLLRSLNNPGTDKAITDYYLGLIALQENNEADARKYFSDGVAANPEYAYNYVGEGLLLLRADDLKGAEAKFKRGRRSCRRKIQRYRLPWHALTTLSIPSNMRSR